MLRLAEDKLLYSGSLQCPVVPMHFGESGNSNHTLASGMGPSNCPKCQLIPSFHHDVIQDVKTQKMEHMPSLHAPETCSRDGQAAFLTKTTRLRCVRPVHYTYLVDRAAGKGISVKAVGRSCQKSSE